MKSLPIQLDEQTLAALNRVAGPGKRQRSEFIRKAICRAIRQAEYHAMREAYREQPDSVQDADDWSIAEEMDLGFQAAGALKTPRTPHE